jgi:hypothetical protein
MVLDVADPRADGPGGMGDHRTSTRARKANHSMTSSARASLKLVVLLSPTAGIFENPRTRLRQRIARPAPFPNRAAARVPTPFAGAAHPGATRRGVLPPADTVREHRRAEAAPAPVGRARERRDRRAGFALAPAVAVRGACEQVRAGLGRFGDAARRMRGPLTGDANAGPNPGGGFYGAPNLNVGRINP